MDTLKTTLVNSAFREGNLVPVGRTPNTAEAAEGLTILNEFIRSLFGTTVGEFLQALPLPIPDNFQKGLRSVEDPKNPPVNRRLFLSNTSAETVKFPLRPVDGSRLAVLNVASTATVTLDGNGKFIDPGDRTFDTTFAFPGAAGEYYEWFYRADFGMWILLSTNDAGSFTSLDSSPFPTELDNLLIAGASIRLQSRYGNEPLGGTVDAFTRGMKNAKARYTQSEDMITNPVLPISLPAVDNFSGFR